MLYLAGTIEVTIIGVSYGCHVPFLRCSTPLSLSLSDFGVAHRCWVLRRVLSGKGTDSAQTHSTLGAIAPTSRWRVQLRGNAEMHFPL